MKPQNVSDLMTKLILEYKDNPYDWHVLRGKDNSNHLNTFISHGNKKLWQFKTEWKNPVTPVGAGTFVKRNLNDEIDTLMKTGVDLPIHEFYPNEKNLILALGLGKYSKESTDSLKEILTDIPGYSRNIEGDLNLELKRIIKKERLFDHYI